jgi:predicted transposase/invertase (TIGR01784 family)
LRSEEGELIDSQMTFITVELSKFDKQLDDIQTDLEKLVYTMKTLHRTTTVNQYPQFWNEDWLKRAIDELDTRKMTPDERAYFARVTAANAEAVKAEKKKIQEAKEEGKLEVKSNSVKKALKRGRLSVEEIAEDNDTTIDFVLSIQKQISTDS